MTWCVVRQGAFRAMSQFEKTALKITRRSLSAPALFRCFVSLFVALATWTYAMALAARCPLFTTHCTIVHKGAYFTRHVIEAAERRSSIAARGASPGAWAIVFTVPQSPLEVVGEVCYYAIQVHRIAGLQLYLVSQMLWVSAKNPSLTRFCRLNFTGFYAESINCSDFVFPDIPVKK